MIASTCHYCGQPCTHQQLSPTDRLLGTFTCDVHYAEHSPKIARALRDTECMPLERLEGDLTQLLAVRRSSGKIDHGWHPVPTTEASDYNLRCPASVWMFEGDAHVCMANSRSSTYKGCRLDSLMELNPHFKPTLNLEDELGVMRPTTIAAWQTAWAAAAPSAADEMRRWWAATPANGGVHSAERQAVMFAAMGVAARLDGSPLHLPIELWHVVISFMPRRDYQLPQAAFEQIASLLA